MSKSIKNKKLTYVDLFSGAGGISQGFKMAGWIPLAAVELMPYASQTYEHNIPIKGKNHLMLNGDITNLKIKKELHSFLDDKEIDVITGGFPCQGFSMAGLRKVDDERNVLYKEIRDLAKRYNPKYIIMENVQGILSMLDGKVVKKIVSDFEKLGYKIKFKTLLSSDYGVPQNRKRVVFIANRLGEKISFPSPLKTEKKTVKDAIYDLKNIEENIEWGHIFTKHTPEMIKRLSKIKPGKSLYENYSDAWRRVYWDRPSPTVKENHGATFVHPDDPRVMTPRELARLQSFPDDFIFKGTKTNQLIQLGNAVPPLMAKAIAEEIMKNIGEKEDE